MWRGCDARWQSMPNYFIFSRHQCRLMCVRACILFIHVKSVGFYDWHFAERKTIFLHFSWHIDRQLFIFSERIIYSRWIIGKFFLLSQLYSDSLVYSGPFTFISSKIKWATAKPCHTSFWILQLEVSACVPVGPYLLISYQFMFFITTR